MLKERTYLDKQGSKLVLVSYNHSVIYIYIQYVSKQGKSVPLQAWSGPEGSWKLRFPDFVTAAQDSGKLSALRTGCLYPQEMLLVFIYIRD